MAIIEGSIPRGQAQATKGLEIYVDTVGGSNNNSGTSGWSDAKATMAAALAIATDNSTIYVVGDVREEVLSPLGVQGCRIVGSAGGNTRHDDGVRWREPASGATSGGALLTLREQGWEVSNILFVPKSDGTALRLRRAEDATYPDGSHALIRNCKFIGAAIATNKGIEDHGGSHHNVIEDCEFHTMQFAITHTVGAGIASPLRWTVRGNRFSDCTNFIDLPGNECLVEKNKLFEDASALNIDTSGGTAGKNVVIDNYLATAQASVTVANGYVGHASDSHWRNFSNNTAAMTVGIPS